MLEHNQRKMTACMLTEGCYPVMIGGLGTQAHALIASMPEVEFDVFCVTSPKWVKPLYPKLPNVRSFTIIPIFTRFNLNQRFMPRRLSQGVAQSLGNALYGRALDVETLIRGYQRYGLNKSWLYSRASWDSVVAFYQQHAPARDFTEVYWTILNLYSLTFDIMSMLPRMPKRDVYHALSPGHAGIIGAMAKVLYNRPLVLSEQGSMMAEKKKELTRLGVKEFYFQQNMLFAQTMLMTSYDYSNRIVPPSTMHVKAEKEWGIDERKIQIIHNGIEVDKFAYAAPRPAAVPAIGCFARVVAVKGFEVLIRAAKIVLDRGLQAEFLILGEIQERDYYEECQKLIDQLGVGEHVKFVGLVNSLEWYRKVDIFALSSYSEGVPYALLEAMSCGLPSVCTAVGGVPDVLHERVGFLVPSGDHAAFAEKLILLIKDPTLRRQMGEAAAKELRAKYSAREMAMDFYALYQQVIDEQRQHPHRS